MFKHRMEMHNHGNGYRDWLFYQNVLAKDLHLRYYLEVYSLSSDQVFLSVQLKTLQKFSGWTFKFNFFAFELYYSSFHILMIKSSYWVDRALSTFLFNSIDWS